MAKTIKLKYENKEYTLEYSRTTVVMVEGQGFDSDKLAEKPVSMIMLLFYGAFAKNHGSVKHSKLDSIFDQITNRGKFIKELLEMYGEAANVLSNDDDDEVEDGEGNANWGTND